LISGTNSPRLLDLRIKGQEPKKLTVTIERKEKKKREKNKIKEKQKGILTTKKKLIKLVNSPATAPKT